MILEPLTFEQLRLIVVVYTSSLVPLVLIPYLYINNKVPAWVPYIYAIFFIVCALGWELWFNYGLVYGDNVDLRRAAQLSTKLPIHVNWLLNSLADSGTICLGGLYLTWIFMKKNNSIFYKWNWKCFFILLTIFVSQNILVEMFLYHDQLSVGKSLSWSPLTPLGPWINPIIFSFNERTIFLQSQFPWLLMTPIFYRFLIYFLNKYYKKGTIY